MDALVIIGEKGSGDEYGIGNPKAYSILEVAELFNSVIELLPERNGNRLVASVVSDKTKALGWKPKRNLEDYIKEWINK